MRQPGSQAPAKSRNKREARQLKNWQMVKIETGLAVFAAEDLKIKITDAENDPGCFNINMHKDGNAIKTAFWHSQDMDIPEECYEDDELVWERYFGTPEFLQSLNYVEWKKENILGMTDYAQNELIVGKPYSMELCEQFDWSGAYPVVSDGKIVAIYDMAWQTPDEYAKKPVVNDEYMDADADDVTED